MTDKTQHDAKDRAAELAQKGQDVSEAHEGNRVSADPDAPQPTREPTRDQQ